MIWATTRTTVFSVYSDAISAYGTGNADGNYLCAVAEAVTPVVNGIGSKVIGVIDTSNGLDGIAAIFLNKKCDIKIIADK